MAGNAELLNSLVGCKHGYVARGGAPLVIESQEMPFSNWGVPGERLSSRRTS